MNSMMGWALALIVGAAGWYLFGWQAVVVVVTMGVFWLLLQFNRALKVMKDAGRSPIGHVRSAVMFHARLETGMTMMQMVALAKSLGRQLGTAPETWCWGDQGGAEVNVVLEGGRLASWQLTRKEVEIDATENGTPPASP